jgi:MFS family permease
MMNSRTLRLVLLISCCHALVHIYELSFASVEQMVADDFGVDTEITGWLGTTLRLPFGLCAILAGWLADRYGEKRLLLVYLFGCSGAALIAWISPSLGVLFLAMFTMGMFASIYHPAGVALISHHTRPENRTLALGYHGIFGSAGIACGPFLAALVLAGNVSWRHYYLVLSIPGVLLGILLAIRLAHDREDSYSHDPDDPSPHREDTARWDCYWLLISSAMLAGFVYAAVLNFLPRYLGEADLDVDWLFRELLPALGLGGASIRSISVDNFLAGMVLLLGILGQYSAGRLARPHTLEPFLAFTFFSTVPFLFWMGLAEGILRVWAAAIWAPLFFMHQPLYNSLVAKYVPRGRRSLAYGLSFTAGFGVGSVGSAFAGKIRAVFDGNPNRDFVNYGTLAFVMGLAGVLAIALWRRRGDGRSPKKPTTDNLDG